MIILNERTILYVPAACLDNFNVRTGLRTASLIAGGCTIQDATGEWNGAKEPIQKHEFWYPLTKKREVQEALVAVMQKMLGQCSQDTVLVVVTDCTMQKGYLLHDYDIAEGSLCLS